MGGNCHGFGVKPQSVCVCVCVCTNHTRGPGIIKANGLAFGDSGVALWSFQFVLSYYTEWETCFSHRTTTASLSHWVNGGFIETTVMCTRTNMYTYHSLMWISDFSVIHHVANALFVVLIHARGSLSTNACMHPLNSLLSECLISIASMLASQYRDCRCGIKACAIPAGSNNSYQYYHSSGLNRRSIELYWWTNTHYFELEAFWLYESADVFEV